MAKCLAQKLEDGTLVGVGGASSMVTAAKLAALAGKVRQGCFPNERVLITASGDWEAPVTGIYHILAIDGGNGGQYDQANWVIGGRSGAYKEAIAFFEKGQVIPITIGAGGKGAAAASAPATLFGGITTVGDVDFSAYQFRRLNGGVDGRVPGTKAASAFGGGFGGTRFSTAEWYGAGGGAHIASAASSTPQLDNGGNGCVIITYFNFDKEEGGE